MVRMLPSESQTLFAHTNATISAASAFPETRWTLVISAGDKGDPGSRDALAALCRSYWYPIYAFVRRKGHNADTARDLTQEFFLQLLNRRFFERADPLKGRFRAFLMASLGYFLADQSDLVNAGKRGAGAEPLPFELDDGESRYAKEPFHSETPERIFERRWARATVDNVVNLLRDDFARHGRLDHFQLLKTYLMGQGDVPYADLAKKLNTTEGAMKAGIHRLRKRFRDALRAEVAATVSDPSEVDEELRFLARALSGKSAAPSDSGSPE